MLCSAAQEVEVYLVSSILDRPNMFKLMGKCLMEVLCRSLTLERDGQTLLLGGLWFFFSVHLLTKQYNFET